MIAALNKLPPEGVPAILMAIALILFALWLIKTR